MLESESDEDELSANGSEREEDDPKVSESELEVIDEVSESASMRQSTGC
jgi:hypothetical protein